MQPSESQSEINPIRIELIETTTGRPINCWTFSAQREITIGRSPERDVELSHPYVSRHHASLIFRDGYWQLISSGRNGVLVSNQLVNEQPVKDELQFRLGAQGPTFKCSVVNEVDVSESNKRTDADTSQLELDEARLAIDETKFQREVNEVVDSEWFAGLQRLAKQMRSQRDA